ncbi:MAG: hypothetical protein IJ572_00665 [Bacilli bacterium]|nr:hypothetical protein [Bacilli bacterium]
MSDPVGIFCDNTQSLFSLLGVAVTAIKIAIPIILIVFGMLDMGKAVTSGKDDEIKKELKSFLTRAIAAVLVFFVPTIVGLLMQMVNQSLTDANACGYSRCVSSITGVSGKCSN